LSEVRQFAVVITSVTAI